MPVLLKRWVFFATMLMVLLTFFFSSFRPFNGDSIWTEQNAPYTPPPRVEDGRFHWEDLPTRYPVTSMLSLPSGRPLSLPRVQHEFGSTYETTSAATTRKQRKDSVEEVFNRCWKTYKERAWLHDEVGPISGGAKDPFGGWAATLVDSLDTLWIMNMKEEFEDAVSAVLKIDFSKSSLEEVNVFETTIRYLGGFLSAYDLSGDKRLLDKAVEIGEMLYVAFDTPNRMPITRWRHEAAKTQPQVASDWILVAEIGSLTLEFTHLSQLTHNMKWFDAVQRITDVFDEQQSQTGLPGMWPLVVNPQKKDFFTGTTFTLGAMADSLYEYFPKMYALLGGLSTQYKKLYEDSMAAAIQHNLYRPMTPENADVLISGATNIENGKPVLDPQGQHLVCFAGGMLAFGGRLTDNATHLDYAQKLTDGCIYTYKALPLGMMPETFSMEPCPSKEVCQWDETKWHDAVLEKAEDKTRSAAEIIASERLLPGFTSIPDRRYWLRPEAIESVFILYRITGRPDLLETAWDMWSAISKYTKTDIASAGLWDITVEKDPPQADSMESYWMAETLKYFYLIFSEPDLISLDEYVFNTEAHPLKRPK